MHPSRANGVGLSLELAFDVLVVDPARRCYRSLEFANARDGANLTGDEG